MQLYRTICQFQIPFTKSLDLFRSFTEPIILYNSENLFTLSDSQINKYKLDHNSLFEIALSKMPATQTQLKFIKFILGVNKSCPTMAVLGEAGCVPLAWKGYLAMLKFWDRIRRMDNQTFVNKAFMENVNLNTQWCQTIQILNASQQLNTRSFNALEFPTFAKKNLNGNFSKYWKSRISDRNVEKKLSLYNDIKPTLSKSPYLDKLPFKQRKSITKFITSNHDLMIERGRHIGLNRCERICKTCTSKSIEDEEHFLYTCPTYQELRHKYISPNLSLNTPDTNPKLADFIRSIYPPNFAKYLKAAFTLRRELTTTRYYVAGCSLTGLQLTLSKGIDPLENYFVKNRTADGLRLTLRKRGKRYKSLPKLTKINLSADGLRFKISRK